MHKIRVLIVILASCIALSANAAGAHEPNGNSEHGEAHRDFGYDTSKSDKHDKFSRQRDFEMHHKKIDLDDDPASKATHHYHFDGDIVSPVPEPESWALMLVGVGLVVYQVRRRQRTHASWDLT